MPKLFSRINLLFQSGDPTRSAAPDYGRRRRCGGQRTEADQHPIPVGFRFVPWALALLVVLVCIGASSRLDTAGATTPPASSFRFVHDQDGRLLSVVKPEDETATYHWDAGGNLLSITRQSSGLLSFSGMQPSRGSPGALVDIRGTEFSSSAKDDTVEFDGVKAAVEAANFFLLKVKVPPAATPQAVARR